MRTLDETVVLAPEARSVLLACKQIIHGFVPKATVLLYGSRARGAGEPDSDFDVLVLTDRPLSIDEQDRIGDAVYELELREGVVMSLMFFSRTEWDTPLHRAMPLHQNIEAEGIVL